MARLGDPATQTTSPRRHMQLLRLRQADQNEFEKITEMAMDLHFAQSRREEFYLVIGDRVSIILLDIVASHAQLTVFFNNRDNSLDRFLLLLENRVELDYNVLGIRSAW
jgi:hypothetical protein